MTSYSYVKIYINISRRNALWNTESKNGDPDDPDEFIYDKLEDMGLTTWRTTIIEFRGGNTFKKICHKHRKARLLVIQMNLSTKLEAWAVTTWKKFGWV